MTEINRLGVSPSPAAEPTGPAVTRVFQAGVFAGALVVFFALVGLSYRFRSSEAAHLEQDLRKEKAREADLASVKVEFQRYLWQVADLQSRKDTIDVLAGTRVGPAGLMTALGKVVNRRTDVDLYEITFHARRLALRGESHSVDSLGNFLASLKSTGNFSDLQLREFSEETRQNGLAYRFNIDCVYSPP